MNTAVFLIVVQLLDWHHRSSDVTNMHINDETVLSVNNIVILLNQMYAVIANSNLKYIF